MHTCIIFEFTGVFYSVSMRRTYSYIVQRMKVSSRSQSYIFWFCICIHIPITFDQYWSNNSVSLWWISYLVLWTAVEVSGFFFWKVVSVLHLFQVPPVGPDFNCLRFNWKFAFCLWKKKYLKLCSRFFPGPDALYYFPALPIEIGLVPNHFPHKHVWEKILTILLCPKTKKIGIVQWSSLAWNKNVLG